MRAALLAVLALGLAACGGGAKTVRVRPEAGARSGLDALVEQDFAPLRGKRVGVLANRTAVDRRGAPILQLLAAAPGVTLVSVFAPEHGFAGAVDTSLAHMETAADSDTVRVGDKVYPVFSLYRDKIYGMRPKPEQLAGLDVLVFDMQEVGARFYTYAASMAMALEECKKAGVTFMVLDRPNPVDGVTVEGPVLEDLSLRLVTATAYFPVPVRHGLTMGELARLHNREVGHDKLVVVPLRGWKREMWYDQTGLPWVPPSPNIPDVETAGLYSGIGIFESADLSVGRGTPWPFHWIGAPWMDAEAVLSRVQGQVDGVEFSVQDYTPAKSGKRDYMGEPCHGIRIKVTDRSILRPLTLFLHLALALREVHPKEFSFRWDETKRMVGVEEFRRLYETGAGMEAFVALFDKGPAEFEKTRRGVLLY
jgi:uncharacterized protein YbbC (DUF1343 family)